MVSFFVRGAGGAQEDVSGFDIAMDAAVGVKEGETGDERGGQVIPNGKAEDGIEHGFCGDGGGIFEGLGMALEGKRDRRENYRVGCRFPAVEGDDVVGRSGRVGLEVGENAGFGFENWVSVPTRGHLYG